MAGDGTRADDVPALSRPRTGRVAAGNRRPDIQGLRALAIVFVVAFHAGLPVSGGFVGVDVFFVISGFVITAMLMREWQRTGRIGFGAFYFRRFKRLTPALALVVAVALLLAPLILSPLGPQQNLASTAIGAMLLVANIVIARTTGNYFDLEAELNPLLHTWSLSLEEQFYLIFPLLLVLGFVLARRSRLGAAAPVLITTGVLVVSFLAATGALPVALAPESLVGFYGPITRVWEFAAGALLALTWHRLPRLSRTWGTATGLAGAVLLAVSLWTIGPATPFPGGATLLPVAGAILLIYAGLAPTNPVSALISTRPFVVLGDISYSWYLWHWPLIVYASIIWLGNQWVPAAAALLSLIPALVSYRYVEQPIRALGAMPWTRTTRLVAATVLPPLALAGLLTIAVNAGYWHPEVRRYQESVLPEHIGSEECRAGSAKPACQFHPDASGAPIYLVGNPTQDTSLRPLSARQPSWGGPQRFSRTRGAPSSRANWCLGARRPIDRGFAFLSEPRRGLWSSRT